MIKKNSLAKITIRIDEELHTKELLLEYLDG